MHRLKNRDTDFASHQSTELLNAAAMVTACELAPLFTAPMAAEPAPSRPQDPPEDDPPAGNAPKSPTPPPKPPESGNSHNQLPTRDSRKDFLRPETACVTYYGYRHYDPATGRWPSRDPIGENGGVNLYGFVGNTGINYWDYLGLQQNQMLFNAILTASARATVDLKLDEDCCTKYGVDALKLIQYYTENGRMQISAEYDASKVTRMNIMGVIPNGLLAKVQIEAEARAGATKNLQDILDGNNADRTLHHCLKPDGPIVTEITIPAESKPIQPNGPWA